MGRVRSRKFCCCLPVRFGVFIMSIMSIIFGGLLSAGGIVAIRQYQNHQITLSQRDKIALFVQTGVYTLLALASIFGFIGACARKRTFVSAYSTTLFSLFGLSVGTGAFFLWGLFHQDTSQAVADCIDGSLDEIKQEACREGTKVLTDGARIATTITLVVFWLIQLYGCFIVSDYVRQLEDEEDAAAYPPQGGSPPMVTTYNFAPGVQPAAAPGQYPFAGRENSYGTA